DGTLLGADSGTTVVRPVPPAGPISTAAGMGPAGFAGDGGPAARALLDEPVAVLTDPAGGYFIADFLNDRVRHVGADGAITSVAGNSLNSATGDGGPASRAAIGTPIDLSLDDRRDLYISDIQNRRVRVVDTT